MERKIFSIVAKRLADFLLKNHYIDTSVQKGGIPGVPGCLEYTGVVTQLLRDAMENRGDLSVLWLDPANTYGSMLHKLAQEMLKRYHMPDCTISVILFALTMNMPVKSAEPECRGPKSKSLICQPLICAFMDAS